MEFKRHRRKLLGQIMLERGLINSEQLHQALLAQHLNRELLGRTLVEMGFISELDMFECVSRQDGLPFPSRFLPLFHRPLGTPAPLDAFARTRTRSSP